MSTKSKKKSTKSAKPKKRKAFKVIYITLLFVLLITASIGFGIFSAIVKTSPELDINNFLKSEETTILLASDNTEMDQYNSSEKRISVDIKDVPEHLKNAFIFIEDRRFETHNGIDIRRLGGVLIEDAKIILGLSDGSLQGASTITQQLVKYKFFLEDSLNNRGSIKRKVQEMYLAIQLEKDPSMSKDKILQEYMNTIFLGGSSHGIEAAANMYFNKSVGELTLKQCAFIAGAAQNPSVSYDNAYEAFSKNQPFDSPRTKLVLSEMLKYDAITQQQYDEAIAEPLMMSFSNKSVDKMNYEWFSRPVIEQVIKDLMETYKYSETEAHEYIKYGGLKIYTTMDRALQDSSQKIINESFSGYDNLQASAVIIDYRKGQVKAIIGGRGEQPPLSYNRAASDNFLRAPGSSIKPLTVYAPAIESKELTAGSVFVDGPLPKDVGSKYPGDGGRPYNPTNLPNKYDGYITMRDAIRYSKNTIAVTVEDRIGLKLGAEYGKKFGIHIDPTDESSISALSLGQLNGGNLAGTTPLAMAQAFGTFGNEGMMSNSKMYTKITDKNGKIILEPKYEVSEVISSQTAYIMYDLMKDSVSGTGSSARFGNIPVSGKTGTSSDYKDIYFAGLTPYYSGAVWIGYDDYSELERNIRGSNTSAGLWGKIMKSAHKDLPYKEIERPSGIVDVSISKDSGTLPSDLTKLDPRGNRIYSEMFISGTQPTTIDKVHVEADVVKVEVNSNGKNESKYYLPSPTTPKDKIEKRVFITREANYDGNLADNAYLLPTEIDPTVYDVVPPGNEENTDPIPSPDNGGDIENPDNTTPPNPGDNNNNGNTNTDNTGNTGTSNNNSTRILNSPNSGGATSSAPITFINRFTNMVGNLQNKFLFPLFNTFFR